MRKNNDIVEVFRLFGFEYCTELFWRADYPWSGDFYIAINCSDTFYWGASDNEEISAEDIPDLRQCLREQQRLQKDPYPADWYVPWLCRKRGQRPLDAVMEDLNEWVHRVIESEFPY